MKKLLCLLAGISFLAGCALYAYPDTADKVVAKTTSSRDPFNKITKTVFPLIQYHKLPNDEICEMIGKTKWGLIPNVSYRIVAVAGDDGIQTYALKSSQTRSSWAFYNRVYDAEGTKLDLLVDRKINSNGTVTEDYSIILPEEYLIKHRNKNIAFKVYGKNDTILFHVQGVYMDGVLKYFGK